MTTTSPSPVTAPAPPTPAPARTRRASLASPGSRGLRILCAVALTVIAIAFLLPFGWLVLASFDAGATLNAKLPEVWTLSNFQKVATARTAGVPLLNSLLLSLGSAAITVACAVLAAYPLSRFRMRMNDAFMYGILFGTCLPITAMMVPVYALFVQLNLLDTRFGTIAFLAATGLPMAIFMTKSFMDSVPISLEEAAWVDGATSMRTLWSVVLPLMRPGLAVVFVFNFVGVWGNFFVPFILLLSPEKHPAAVSIFSFFGAYGAVAYGQLAAFSLLYSVPVLVLYVIVQKFLGGGFNLAGAVKG